MNDPSRKARLASPEPRLLQMAGLPALILAFSCVGGADGPPPLARFGPHTLNVDEVTELVVPVENVPADVNTVAAIAVTWADFIALADLLTEDSVLTSLDFDAAVVPVVNQEMISALRELEFPLDTVVTDDELVEAYEQTDPPVRLSASHILLRYPPNATDAYRDRVRDGANEILARLRAGEGFARLAISFSEDPGSAPLGGDLGEFSPGEMLPALDSALGGLNEGDVGGAGRDRFGPPLGTPRPPNCAGARRCPGRPQGIHPIASASAIRLPPRRFGGGWDGTGGSRGGRRAGARDSGYGRHESSPAGRLGA